MTYIKLELAKLLKEKGINTPHEKSYYNEGILMWTDSIYEEDTFIAYAPTQEQISTLFRKRGIYVWVSSELVDSESIEYVWNILYPANPKEKREVNRYKLIKSLIHTGNSYSNPIVESYEEMLELGLLKAASLL